jgi:ketosteroid isomerase-like protein
MRRTTTAGLAVLALAACQSAPQFTEQDAASVRAMFDSTAVWVKTGNLTAWSNEYTEDAAFMAPNAKAIHGRAAILAFGQAMGKLEQLSFGNLQVSGEGNVAWGTSSYVLKAAGAPADTGKELVVFTRGSDGKWMVKAGAFNSDLPLPVAAPSKAPSKAPAKAPAKKGR